MAWNVSGLAVSNSSSTSSQSNSTAAVSSINEAIQSIAQRYCVGCKNAFEEMSKVTQAVTATRQELAKYDLKQQDTLTQVFRASPSASPSTQGQPPEFSSVMLFAGPGDTQPKSFTSVATKCFACTLSCIKHCLTILRAFVTNGTTHSLMLKEVRVEIIIINIIPFPFLRLTYPGSGGWFSVSSVIGQFN